MHSSMCPTVHGLGFVHCGQVAWKKWPTNWHAHVSRWLMLSCHWQLWVLLPMCLFDCLLVFSFVGRWLLPSLVDTGDICCHYWQHILVVLGDLLYRSFLFFFQTSSYKSKDITSPGGSSYDSQVSRRSLSGGQIVLCVLLSVIILVVRLS